MGELIAFVRTFVLRDVEARIGTRLARAFFEDMLAALDDGASPHTKLG